MSALQTLIAAADGTTDEDAHVFVPVRAIRELQAWMPGEKERLTTNGAAAWAGVDPQDLRNGPEHVQRAAMDEDIRQAAIEWAGDAICKHCYSAIGYKLVRWNTQSLRHSWVHGNPHLEVDRALRILRHFGLLVEHGDGVVSILEQTK